MLSNLAEQNPSRRKLFAISCVLWNTRARTLDMLTRKQATDAGVTCV